MTSYGNTKSIFDTMYGSRYLLGTIFFVQTKEATYNHSINQNISPGIIFVTILRSLVHFVSH
jgi:hypothetical protein